MSNETFENNKKREIFVSENSGFCFGVKRALDKTMEQLNENTGELEGSSIYTLGPLIHNKTVIDDLSAKGINIIDEPEQANHGDTVIVRSHGQGDRKSVV